MITHTIKYYLKPLPTLTKYMQFVFVFLHSLAITHSLEFKSKKYENKVHNLLSDFIKGHKNTRIQISRKIDE